MRAHRKLAGASFAALAIGGWWTTCAVAESLGTGLRALTFAGLALETSLALLALGGACLAARPVAEGLGLVRVRSSAGGLALLVLGTVALSHGLDCLLELSGLREHSALMAFDDILAGARGTDLALALVSFGLAAAVGEELLCRGWIQRGLEPRIGAAGAVVVAALIFGALHADPVHAAFAALLGLYLGVVAWVTGSVWACVLCHGVNNVLAVLFAAGVLEAPPHDPPGMLLALGVAAGALALEIHRRVPRGPDAEFAHDARSNLQPEDGTDDA